MFIANAIGDVFEFVIGAVEDVGSFVVEEIIQPVATAVSDVVEAVIDDPIATIANIAATVSGNLWAVPLINGADTIAKGGSFGDVLKSVALDWIAPKVGSYVSGAITGATGNILGAGVKGAIKTGDLRGAILGGVSTEIASAATDIIVNNLPSGDFGQFTVGKNTKDFFNKGIKAYIDTGGELDEAGFIAATATVSGLIKENSNFDGPIEGALLDATIAALKGGDALGAFNAALQVAGTKDLNAKLDSIALPPQTKFYDVNGGEHSSADGANAANKDALDAYNTASANYKNAAKAYKNASASYNSAGRGGAGQRKRATADMATADSAMSGAKAIMNGYEAAVTNRVDLDLNDAHTKERNDEAIRLKNEKNDAASATRIKALADAKKTAEGFVGTYDDINEELIEKVKDATATAAKEADIDEIETLLTAYDGTTAEDFDNLVGELTTTLVGTDGYNPYEGDDGSIEVASNATGEFIQMLLDRQKQIGEGEFGGDSVNEALAEKNKALAEQMESLYAKYEGATIISPLGGVDAIAREYLTASGMEGKDWRDLKKFENSFKDIGEPRSTLAEDASEAVNAFKITAAAIGLNSISGIADMTSGVLYGTSLTWDQLLDKMDPTGKLNEEVTKIWMDSDWVQTTPSMVRKAAEAGITVEEWKEQNFNPEYAELSDDEKRIKVHELVKQHAYDNSKDFFVNATSGAVTWLDNKSEKAKALINDDFLTRMYYALPAEGMDFTTALPGGEYNIRAGSYGVALDRKGRPYGTDYWATFANAAEEFADPLADVATSKIPYIGDILNVLFGTMEGLSASMKDVEDATEKALARGDLDNIAEWQKILSDSDGDVKVALDRLNNSFYNTALMAGSVEGFADAATARIITHTMSIKTIGDLFTKLTAKQRKALGISTSVTTAAALGGFTEALQQK